MPVTEQMTLKKVGDHVRARLKTAQANGVIPAGPNYAVRVTSRKDGAAIHVTIDRYDRLIGDVKDPAACQKWRDTEGQALIAKVDQIVGRGRYSPPLGGTTKFGYFVVASQITGEVRT